MSPLQAFIEAHPRLFVLTGAGCSTASGIPDYRDRDGQWKRTPPVTFAAFMQEAHTRQRYWARSLVGWRRFGHTQPNATHRALVGLERQGRIELLVTQNVDGLHQRAGNTGVVDLHGRLDTVRCMACDWRESRHAFQHALVERNPAWRDLDATDAPDGDADLEHQDFARFDVPPCPQCGGIVKPDVVFFGENVPRQRVAAAMEACLNADAMLVVGSSLMVYSGYRFAHAAAQAGRPVAAVTLGRTRADALLALKVDAPCEQAFGFLLEDADLASVT
ncbi:MAG: NAD-dependent protein deacetylase [Xanthomonadaceae bacterium]|nr:NAD-dependent protein deacetylase [Xanthomonadaceae bacterium]